MIKIRAAARADLGPMTDVINPIIRAGGTTAFQETLSATDLAAMLFDHPNFLFAFVALDNRGTVAGFQYLMRLPEAGMGDIASFTRRDPSLKGAGRALMAQTIAAARAAGLCRIRAKIRSDNAPGLGYYEAMGFRTEAVERAVPLADGTPVDRVLKFLELGKTPSE